MENVMHVYSLREKHLRIDGVIKKERSWFGLVSSQEKTLPINVLQFSIEVITLVFGVRPTLVDVEVRFFFSPLLSSLSLSRRLISPKTLVSR